MHLLKRTTSLQHSKSIERDPSQLTNLYASKQNALPTSFYRGFWSSSQANNSQHFLMDSSASPVEQSENLPSTEDPIIQYILIRKDLLEALKWPVGAIIAQACHASVAAITANLSDNEVVAYLNRQDNMRKVVLAVNSETELRKFSAKLAEKNVQHKLWIEQPEGIPTCIATKPIRKCVIKTAFKGLALFR
ncbi:Peptidyl-tRna hydrolase PTH2 domain-containing protein [Cardiosporidium cionae]|uniref:peptidyl-tRNA hydrolase n=1 Tax=Cardiosporidium cionae TaxID=476202 RepID=A0ABQ7JGA7_9APIC|nr:Peptidyl-tRna hydrolase PTH2 domain-containing protein [Cardiosporidium cionae]|eukprot:KAF8822899.1 Peptidyl-tRna hydrolase PTH2 domain-containing protein [Cardiosporidium cionae]